jgi:hypothetical protein
MLFSEKGFFQKSMESALVPIQNKVLIYLNLLLIQQKKVHQNRFSESRESREINLI